MNGVAGGIIVVGISLHLIINDVVASIGASRNIIAPSRVVQTILHRTVGGRTGSDECLGGTGECESGLGGGNRSDGCYAILDGQYIGCLCTFVGSVAGIGGLDCGRTCCNSGDVACSIDSSCSCICTAVGHSHVAGIVQRRLGKCLSEGVGSRCRIEGEGRRRRLDGQVIRH